jgi:hypothetical protein
MSWFDRFRRFARWRQRSDAPLEEGLEEGEGPLYLDAFLAEMRLDYHNLAYLAALTPHDDDVDRIDVREHRRCV